MRAIECKEKGHDYKFNGGDPMCWRCGQYQFDTAPDRCQDCGALVNGDGISIDEWCCFYCKAD